MSSQVIDLCSSSDEDETDTAPLPARVSQDDASIMNHPGAPALFIDRLLSSYSTPRNPTLLTDSSVSRNHAATITTNGEDDTKAKKKTPGKAWLENKQNDFYKHHCFSCQVPLCNTKQRNLEASCYALHAHPVLKIPVCSVCSDEIAAMELTRSLPIDDQVCGICASSDRDQLFLCDGFCSRLQICDQCVQNANPPGYLEELEASDQEWYCPCCKPTSTIQALQAYVEVIQQQQPPQNVDIDTLLGDLEVVEVKKLECEQALDGQGDLQDEIRQELLADKNMDNDEADLQAQEELDSWKDQQEKHHSRLVDMITTLQEELERQGYNLKQYYATDAIENKPTEEPDWKQTADTDIATREREERKKGPPPPQPPPEEDEDDLLLDDVEDLGSLSDGLERDTAEHSQWRSSQYRAQPWQIERALQAEENLLSQQDRPVPAKILESHDTKATAEEDRLSARVRRDSLVVIRQCQQRRQEATARKRTLATKRSIEQTTRRNSISSKKGSASSEFRSSSKSSEEETYAEEMLPIVAVGAMGMFENSSCILTTDPHQRSIRVAERLAKLLKPHQKEGVQFMFQNTFHDLAFPEDKLTEEVKEGIGGCILAHNMGLGKSLSCVALLHTLFFHPSLSDKDHRRNIHTAILVAPVNTIRNWENEFDKWTQGMGTLIRVHNLADGGNRGRTIQRWAKQGGVLLTSDALFRNTVKKMEFEQYLRSPGPDVIILDEAHIMLKNKSNAVFKALNGVKTRRRICLTGSPFQNNLFEFFRMASYIRPGVLGNSEASFEKGYVNPIISGMSSDATGEAKRIADKKLNEIQELLLPFVQRKDASILLQDLRPMQQVVLHIRQTKVQSRLYSAYRRHQKSSDDRDSMNFLRMYSALRPVNNHPGCLLLREPKTGKENGKSGAFVGDATKPGDMTPPPARLALAGSGSNLSSSNSNEISKAESEANLMKVKQEIIAKEEIKENIKTECCVETKKVDAMKSPPDDVDVIDLLSDSEEEVGENALEDDPITGEWWSTVLQKTGIDKLSEIESGNKVLLLLHILTHADKLNEKVVLFSQCLKTLDFISNVLSQDDWPSLVPSLAEAFPSHCIGGWKAGRQFLRIDGATSAGARGDRITQFNEDSVRLFLISSRAGGIGINLCSASRVILFDSSFNPTVDMQALYRCYRYGQKRDVFAYRFLTEGTTEGKVYSRAVNKSSLALSLIDGKTFQRVFTEEETADCSKTDNWAICDRCNQWRMFPPDSIDISALPDKWYCEMMNGHDKSMVIDCTFPEMEEPWYWRHFAKMKKDKAVPESPIIAMSGNEVANLSDDKKEKLAARDEILMHLLDVSSGQKKSKVVSRYTFHDALLDKEETEKVTSSPNARNTPESLSSTATVAPFSNPLTVQVQRVTMDSDPKVRSSSNATNAPESLSSTATVAPFSNPPTVQVQRVTMDSDQIVGSKQKDAPVPSEKLREKTREEPLHPKKRRRVSLEQPRLRRKLDFKSLWSFKK